VPYAQPVYR